jgi:hypothetical protein
MIAAKFSDPDDFLAELKLDSKRIEGRIVRVTPVTIPDSQGPMQHVTVEATAIIEARSEDRPDRLVRLVTYCGELWNIDKQDEPVRERVGRIMRKVQAVGEELGLEVRGGAWIDEQE